MQETGKEYAVRNYRPGDLNNLWKLHLEAEINDFTGSCPSPSQLRERFGHPRFVPEENVLLVENEGQIAAFLQFSNEEDIGRVILNGLVHPLHRRRGLASMLLEASYQRSAGLGAKVIHASAARHNTAARELLGCRGFTHLRTFLELRAKAAWVCEKSSKSKEDLQLRQLRPGEEELLAELQNRCFTGTWGFNPNTVEDIYYTTSLGNSSIKDVVACFKGGEPVAYCWTMWSPGDKKGRIHMMGVVPGHRGRGFARLVLSAGASYLYRQGVEVVDLTADGGNNAACQLYFSAGFKTWSETLWYEKSLAGTG